MEKIYNNESQESGLGWRLEGRGKRLEEGKGKTLVEVEGKGGVAVLQLKNKGEGDRVNSKQ